MTLNIMEFALLFWFMWCGLLVSNPTAHLEENV